MGCGCGSRGGVWDEVPSAIRYTSRRDFGLFVFKLLYLLHLRYERRVLPFN